MNQRMTPRPQLIVGESLAQYQIEAKLGEGGMGAVYRAFDTKLHRKVALKVLAPERFSSTERKLRLIREARSASALNHPNIVTIYEIGSDQDVDFIAMEYVEGKRLDELIVPKPLRQAQVLRYAVQAAEALAVAHAAGIIHRDLKPSNMMVTEEGRLKILDFGLAKAVEPTESSPDSPTITMSALTEEGTIVGTAAYMSPEQAQGRKLDQRSDIFSFGSVLYEMSTGRRAFAADSRLTLLTKIVNDDPQPPSDLAALPPGLEKVILRCLRKDSARRYQTMADLKVDLEDIEAETSGRQTQSGKKTPPKSEWRPRSASRKIAVVAGIVIALAAVAGTGLRFFSHSADGISERTVKFTITPKNLTRGSDTDIDAEVSISRDGKHIAYVEAPEGQLWIRDIDEEEVHPVPGATAVYQVFWSPDNQYIGYSVGRACGIRGGCDLVRIPVQGGTPLRITKLEGSFKRASWSSDGETVVYCDSTGMYTVPTKSGPVTRILAHPHIEHPSFLDLPGGKHAFLYQAVEPGTRGHGLYVQVVGEERRRLLLVSQSSNPYPAYSPTGHIVYVDGIGQAAAIWALPFSLEKLEATGKPFLIVQQGSSPMVSPTGTLVYSDVPSDRQQLGWVDRSGGKFTPIGEPERQNGPALSPDGRMLAIAAFDRDVDIFVYDLDRGIKSRLTHDPAAETLGAWTPSGNEITYFTNDNNPGLFSISSGGSGALVPLASPARLPDWSSDGKYLMYTAVSPETQGDLVYRERKQDGSLANPVVFLKTPFRETAARFSPDGRFVVYMSDESGQNEIYARDFPKGANRWQVSSKGGAAPRWSHDCKEIFYVEGQKLMAVSVATRPDFSAKTPVQLFEKRSLQNPIPQYDVSPDGKRFIILERPANEQPLSIHVVHNWFTEFRDQRER
jgi:serine/threonine protein kinase